MLFNLALEYVIRKLPADANRTVEYKVNQVVGYADDVCLLGRSARSVNEVYEELKITAEKIGLNININKTKAVLQTRTQSMETEQLRIDDHNIQVVDSFVYLGSCITKDNGEYIETQRRLKLANKAYFSLLAVMRCKDIHKKTKVMPYKTLIHTILTYGSNTWTLSKNSENALSTFERKILRIIYSPVQNNGQRRIRYKKELYELYSEPDLVTCIKLKRLQWAGHVQRMEGTRIPKKVFKAKFKVGWKAQEKMGRCGATGSWPLMIEHCGGRR
jgi:hypothetical protein